MQALLTNPAVQAGLAPFVVALLVALIFMRVRLSGLAIIAGFAITIYLASDFAVTPLTAARKIVLLGLASAVLALLPGLHRLRWFGSLLPLLGGIAVLWTVQRILQHQPTQIMLLWGTGCAAYVAFLVWSMDTLLGQTTQRTASAAAALGIGTGGAALVGGSALLGQYGLALGAAAIAHLLVQMIRNKPLPTGRVFTLPLAVIAGITACLAVLSGSYPAQLPWYALPVLALIPLSARFMPLPGSSVRLHGLMTAVMTFIPAVVAIYLTWRIAGDVPF